MYGHIQYLVLLACGTRHDHVTAFVKQLGETLTIVDATVAARQRLSSLLQSHTQLCRVPVQKWAGVGAVWSVHLVACDINFQLHSFYCQRDTTLRLELEAKTAGNDYSSI